jgi:hypothetical protein
VSIKFQILVKWGLSRNLAKNVFLFGIRNVELDAKDVLGRTGRDDSEPLTNW